MGQPVLDHRRATAQRNAAAILDAAERLLAAHEPLTMASVAAEAGVSRPTLYSHFATLGEVVAAVAERAVRSSETAYDAAEPDAGPADAALHRVLAASWTELARHEAVARAAAEHLPSGRRDAAHAPLMARLRELVERGQREGAFRDDLPADWLVTSFFALVHAADEHARARRVGRLQMVELLGTTVADLFAPR